MNKLNAHHHVCWDHYVIFSGANALGLGKFTKRKLIIIVRVFQNVKQNMQFVSTKINERASYN